MIRTLCAAERPSSRIDTACTASCRSLAAGSLAPDSRTAAARTPIDPCISWTRVAGVSFELVNLDATLEGRLDAAADDDSLDLEELAEGVDFMCFFLTGSEDIVGIETVGEVAREPSDRTTEL